MEHCIEPQSGEAGLALRGTVQNGDVAELREVLATVPEGRTLIDLTGATLISLGAMNALMNFAGTRGDAVSFRVAPGQVHNMFEALGLLNVLQVHVVAGRFEEDERSA